MRIPQRLMPHGGLVSYRLPAGQSGNGLAYSAPIVPERACIQEKRRLIRGMSEQVSTAQVWLDPEHDLPVGTLVTIWRGRPKERETTVLAVEHPEHGPLPEHIEAFCE